MQIEYAPAEIISPKMGIPSSKGQPIIEQLAASTKIKQDTIATIQQT